MTGLTRKVCAILVRLPALLAVFLLVLTSACAGTMTPRQKRIHDCLHRCNQQQATRQVRDADQMAGQSRDIRTACERDCHALR
jgi:hypothetical protein